MKSLEEFIKESFSSVTPQIRRAVTSSVMTDTDIDDWFDAYPDGLGPGYDSDTPDDPSSQIRGIRDTLKRLGDDEKFQNMSGAITGLDRLLSGDISAGSRELMNAAIKHGGDYGKAAGEYIKGLENRKPYKTPDFVTKAPMKMNAPRLRKRVNTKKFY